VWYGMGPFPLGEVCYLPMIGGGCVPMDPHTAITRSMCTAYGGKDCGDPDSFSSPSQGLACNTVEDKGKCTSSASGVGNQGRAGVDPCVWCCGADCLGLGSPGRCQARSTLDAQRSTWGSTGNGWDGLGQSGDGFDSCPKTYDGTIRLRFNTDLCMMSLYTGNLVLSWCSHKVHKRFRDSSTNLVMTSNSQMVNQFTPKYGNAMIELVKQSSKFVYNEGTGMGKVPIVLDTGELLTTAELLGI